MLNSFDKSDFKFNKFVDSLKKCHITKPDPIVLGRIAKSNTLLNIGAFNTESANDLYLDVKETAGTETKSYIGEFLGLRINGPVFENFPFLFGAKKGNESKMIKVLRVADGTIGLELRQKSIDYEIHACEFRHEAIVPMEHASIVVDNEIAKICNCRIGKNDVLIMPWYTSTLNKYPSGDLQWIAEEGTKVMNALEYIHTQGYVHLDIKAMNIFISVDTKWHLGDFGSCKPIGELVTSSTFQFYFEDFAFKPAHPKYDWFMFLMVILTEILEDRRDAAALFYRTNTSKFANFDLVTQYAKKYVDDSTIGSFIQNLLMKVLQEDIKETEVNEKI